MPLLQRQDITSIIELFGLLLTQNSSKSLGVVLSFDLSLHSLSSPILALVSHEQ